MGNSQNTNDEIEIDLLELFYVLRSKLLVIILSTLVAATAVGLFSKFLISPTYASTTKMYILSMSTSITSFADIQIGNSLTQDYMELIKSRPVVQEVIDNLNLDVTYQDMLKKVTITNPSDTRILCITVKDHDPVLAKEIVDEFAMVSIDRIAEIMDTEKPNIVEEGYVEEEPISPSILKNTAIGAMVGMVLCCGIIIVRHLLDDTIKSSDDLERYLGLNTLAMIPKGKEEYDGHSDKKRRKRKKNKKTESKKRGEQA